MPITRVIKLTDENLDTIGIQDAVRVLHAGGLVAFPTETVYGLGADALNAEAVTKVFTVKGRPPDNPLIVHIASQENVRQFTNEIPDKGLRLVRRFWPGPLTLVVKKRENIPGIVTAGLETIALRVPNHPVTLELLRQFKGGIVGPSANISGQLSPTAADHVYNDLNGKIDIILDAGPTTIGVESTVLDVTVEPPVILRFGGLGREEIESEIGHVQCTDSEDLLKRSPGTRYRHYAPNARIVIFSEANAEEFQGLVRQNNTAKKKVGMITHSKVLTDIEKGPSHVVVEQSVELFARNLFRSLRELDRKGVDVILVESVREKGLGAAIMDRLRKASM